MKNILFVITSFRHGGTNKSLENLLSLIDTEKYQVDVFAMEHYGPYESMLPNCTILPKDKWLHALIAQFRDTKGITKLRSITLKVLRKLMTSLGMNLSVYLYKNAIHSISKNKSYDTVIAFSEGAPTAFAQHFKAPNKIAWIHCDYESYMLLNNQPDETTMYQAYQSIVCVSDFTKDRFCKIIPSLSCKACAIHNVINVSEVKHLSEKIINEKYYNEDVFNIVSVGRINIIKRFDEIPQIARTLLDKGYKFNWILIGPEGEPHEQKCLLENIKKYRVQDTFIWIGEKDNPYPYIKNSDLLVNISISEACPYVINEAKVLHIPVICTNFGSAVEFVDHDVNGLIAPLVNIVDAIELLVKDKKQYNRIKINLEKFSYDNQTILNKIYKIL
ncbi:glycosyltransferase [Flavobacterium channae]|uniref:glycosyltransferase n=1 Tax=Flavobacterium channae TaxID=2897181 RepID=UPI001E309B32|nr:glycosyltransferase [Flavobacterium channae]UGS24171.1 glycosyltransferase [Flavobacterium channae]